MKISIVFNNESNEGFKSGWGFSSLIEEGGKKILFDTGCEGPKLLYNLEKLGYNATDIDIIIISHQHWDHTGGLLYLLDKNNDVEVYVPSSFSRHFKAEIERKARLKEIDDKQEMTTNIYSTGLIKNNPDEQALILKTSKGIVVIVGCSHPGVDKILEIAKTYGKIHAIIGGFHGFSNLDALKGIEMIGACHCTQYMQEIKDKFPKQFKEIKTGDIIEI